jgi:uncharacterized lipoprotein YehR (DUF1307 family)
MRKRSLVPLTLLVVAILLMAMLVGCGSNGDAITMEQFERVEAGMTYEEVAEILGASGRLAHGAGNTRVYHWDVSASGGLITVIFVNDVVDTTAQVGIN